MKRRFVAHIGLLLLVALSAQADPLSFSVSFPKEKLDQPFTGRVVVFVTRGRQEPRFGPNWFRPEPMYARDFANVAPGDAMAIDDGSAIGFPDKLSKLEPGEYTIQAVVDRNLGGRSIGSTAGNLFSKPSRVTLDPAKTGQVKLVCDQVVKEPVFKDTNAVKLVRLKSQLLTDFHHRDTEVLAAVVLPESYDKEPDRHFPVIYTISGFGGSVWGHSGRNTRSGTMRGDVPFIVCELDANCPTGHSVWADSDNNGPWGKALTTELIPEIDKRFRTVAKPEGRLLTGHSSGGWSSLWLQVTYPDFFGGTWSTSPDPVDFRDFQRIDIYNPSNNVFFDDAGNKRPVARRGDQPVLFIKDFVAMEKPLRGEQMGSFEAVFSPRAADGSPARLYDHDTGKIDPKVADAWKRYDIGLILRENWKTLGPKLSGKIHVYMGDIDTFYLDGAVRLLQKDLSDLGSDAVVEIVPGDHGSMMTPDLRDRIGREMAKQVRQTGVVGSSSAVPPTTLPDR